MTDQQPTKPTLLLVDDEPEILFSLKGLLRREFELYTAESGREALEILQQHPIQVIMTDQRMPEMTGVELMGQVKTEYPDAIRIIFTGYADIKAVVDAINNGGLFRYITKPWDPDELLDVLHAAVDEYGASVRNRQLLASVEDYVQKGQQIVQSLLQQTSPPETSQLNQFLEQGTQLLQQLSEQNTAD
jgi:DNA-binding NtrC family response regulator